MSGDFFEWDRRGLAEWLADFGVSGQGDVLGRGDGQGGGLGQRGGLGRGGVPEQRGGPAYVVSFGWLPSQLPPTSPIPAPRRAPDDLR
ncbi:hypothetical protein F4560_005859 [Saccharothrix ecbatanensis]|uniref:Uncharacterized protein n=1 Tax=Saccharothrix ecbatanensis TaxID=1105145 RepID=A0A7W9HQ25_9PSEU|nr:hypothetical protein [Saccharothrix ecbatanensis]